jgi:hypothetical protein
LTFPPGTSCILHELGQTHGLFNLGRVVGLLFKKIEEAFIMFITELTIPTNPSSAKSHCTYRISFVLFTYATSLGIKPIK